MTCLSNLDLLDLYSNLKVENDQKKSQRSLTSGPMNDLYKPDNMSRPGLVIFVALRRIFTGPNILVMVSCRG